MSVPVRKYRNVTSSGFASKRESRRSQELALWQKAGIITNLQHQVKYELIPKQAGERAVTYTADFTYTDKEGVFHCEDSKGFKTQQYIIRRKLMKWVHGIRIEEV